VAVKVEVDAAKDDAALNDLDSVDAAYEVEPSVLVVH
jgi:hypothetical protein